MTPPTTIDLTTAEGRAALQALGGSRALQRGRQARPDLPAAAAATRTGLSSLLKRGWSLTSPDSMRVRLYVVGRPDLDTGYCATERAACDAANALETKR